MLIEDSSWFTILGNATQLCITIYAKVCLIKDGPDWLSLHLINDWAMMARQKCLSIQFKMADVENFHVICSVKLVEEII